MTKEQEGRLRDETEGARWCRKNMIFQGRLLMPDKDAGYGSLSEVLGKAYDHAAEGKGQDRHVVSSESFDQQLICGLERRGHTFDTGQAVKKIDESLRLPPDRAITELLGAINYCAARIIILNERIRDEPVDLDYEPNRVRG